ncbi:uncharacterized protein LOC115331657 [Ixodes scapularis]|uniref:uncharacterized protein LOC115331657 n=1 Tax=Ixodes scapularis TaxID=6945 RepID=UPI001A9EB6ED|nr:uncharacterized protein LOC115331657 [Ixodes scapularis]
MADMHLIFLAENACAVFMYSDGQINPSTQADFFAKGVTSDWVQTDGSGDTAISASTSIPVPSASDDDDSDEEEEEEDDDENKDPTYEPFIKESCVGKDTFTSAEPGYQERKFLVFESCPEQLLSVCKTCYSPCDVSTKGVGTLLVVRTSCPAGHTNRWDSQPHINGRGKGNLLLISLLLFTGASPTRTLRLFQLMNIQVFSKKTYFNYQRAILVRAVEEVWRDEQEKLMEELRDQPLDLAGDGRCDSPGFSAKYLTYSLHVPSVNKILHFEQIQVGECEVVRCSGHMEKEGLVRSLAFTRENLLTVHSLATDRHRSIGKHMREKEPAILHYFDVWHVSKSVKKNLNAAGKSQDCGSIADWAQQAVNHLYWCAAASQGNA